MKKQHDTLHSKAGLTLIEMLVAVILFSIIMMFGMTFFTFSNTSFGHSQHTTFAITLANSEMETMKTVAWADVKTGDTTVTDTQTGIAYRVWCQVQPQSSGGTNYKIITIAVTWPGQKAPVSIVSVRSEN